MSVMAVFFPDIMHDLLEGALQYEVKLMLKYMIMEYHLFTLGNRGLHILML